jgi:hypothetical protein
MVRVRSRIGINGRNETRDGGEKDEEMKAVKREELKLQREGEEEVKEKNENRSSVYLSAKTKRT